MSTATTRMATNTTAAPAAPMPACSGMADQRADPPAGAPHLVASSMRRRALGQFGQAADGDQPQRGADAGAQRVGPAPLDQQDHPGAGADQRAGRCGPSPGA